MYYFQMHGKDLKATPQEINTLLGMHLEMGSVPFPNMRLYWRKGQRYKLIADVMTVNRFSMLRNIQENERSEDKFWKVRPIMNHFVKVLQ